VRLALLAQTEPSSTNTRGARRFFDFLRSPVDFPYPRLVYIRVVESVAHLRRQRVNDLDGLERDCADPVAGLQKADEAALCVEDTAAASRIEPFTLPPKQ
jgi:hypothetical protein